MKNSPAPFELVPLYDENRITERVRALASEIDAVYGDQPLVAVCVLKGAFIFFSDLAGPEKSQPGTGFCAPVELWHEFRKLEACDFWQGY